MNQSLSVGMHRASEGSKPPGGIILLQIHMLLHLFLFFINRVTSIVASKFIHGLLIPVSSTAWDSSLSLAVLGIYLPVSVLQVGWLLQLILNHLEIVRMFLESTFVNCLVSYGCPLRRSLLSLRL